jgi:hypothetical protein
MCEYFSLPRLSVRSLQGGRLNVLQAVLRKYEVLAAYTAINFFIDWYFEFLFRKMFRNGNEYRRQWRAKKRKRMQMQRAADRSVQLSSESDANHSIKGEGGKSQRRSWFVMMD